MKSTYLLGTAALLSLCAACGDLGPDGIEAQLVGNASTQSRASQNFEWGPAPAIFPAGAEMAVLQGDPSVAGEIFTVRLRLPNGYILPPHWHPTDEHVTVIDGTFLVGVGDRFDENAFLPPLHAGGFLTAHAKMNHYAMARGRTVVQVHAMGPFALTYVNPADDPTTR